MDKEIRYALETWYEPGHPLHLDPLHPAIGLAGEAGELLDLYKKESFKDGVSWWDCVYCNGSKEVHSSTLEIQTGYASCNYTPKVLDELGDFWYYLRILNYISGKKLTFVSEHYYGTLEMIELLSVLNLATAQVIYDLSINKFLDTGRLNIAYTCLDKVLAMLDFTLDQVTENNYAKLQKNDNHGWGKARRFHKV